MRKSGVYWTEDAFTGEQRHESGMAVGSNESQNPQADAVEPSDAVSAQGEDKNKKSRKSRQTSKKVTYAIKGRELIC
ncbi:MAG: hypothetical protein LBU32_13635 [Clostridiales bacterium]|nr:hypothetical protein [Clostridiales bacterium]